MDRRSFFKAFSTAPVVAIAAKEEPTYELMVGHQYFCPECVAMLFTLYNKETGEYHIDHPDFPGNECKNNGKQWKKKFSREKVEEVKNHG